MYLFLCNMNHALPQSPESLQNQANGKTSIKYNPVPGIIYKSG